jgi:Chitobiase/beta-hexosaminidase C-terminal domain/Galactose oxidase, central domain
LADAAGTNGNLNDLWEFSPSAREWTWVGGSSNLDANGTVAGVYGTLGSLTAGSFPGSRNNGAAWTSKDGSLWLFGGYGGSTPGQFGTLNDLWRYVPSTKQWAWMGGSSTTLQPGVYGQLSNPAPGNVPGARDGAAAWVDKDGNFWLFGGTGFVLVGSTDVEGYLNDLWKFDPSTTEWAWMSGSDTLPNSCPDPNSACNWPGVYGKLGTADAGNTPGSRTSTVTWTGQDGTLWLFGGTGSDANDVSGILNDFWKFDPAANEWTWMGGSSKLGASGAIAGVYGTLGNAAAENLPGSRTEGVGLTDIYGNFWLFGGSGSDAQGVIGYLNDLWGHLPVTATPTLSLASGTYATAQTVTISDATPGALIYYTTDGTTPTTSSAKYTRPVTVSSTEAINAIAAASGYINGAMASATYTIQPPPTFAFAGSPTSLTVASGSQGTVTLTVTPRNGFDSTVSFACTGLQPSVSCTFSPATVTPSGTGALTTQLTLSASTETGALRWNWRPLSPAAPLALAVGFLWLGKRRRVWMVLLAMGFGGAGMLTACGSGSSSQPPAPNVPVTSIVTVNATSGSIQQSATVTLTIN